MKRFLPVLLIAGVALCNASLASALDFTNDITPDSVLRLMNDYRADRGLPPLHADEKLMRAAHDRMRDMEDGAWWSHQSPDGVSPFVWLTARDYPYAFAGENLACGFETARLLVSSWMESPGHRDNILGAHFDDCGIAIIDGSTKGPANGKSVVVLFGRKR
jgi:uncharacterized protein YkwD